MLVIMEACGRSERMFYCARVRESPFAGRYGSNSVEKKDNNINKK
jgi:hypothetical protein